MADKLKGFLTLEVDDKELEAYLIFVEDPDGDDITSQTLMEHLKKKGVILESDTSVYDDYLKVLRKDKRVLAASGTAPTEPVKTVVNWTEQQTPPELQVEQDILLGAAKAPAVYKIIIEKVKKEKLVDKKSLPFLKAKQEKVSFIEKKEIKEAVTVNDAVVNAFYVDTNDIIANIVSGSPGSPGKNVFGRPIPAPSLNDDSILPGNGVEVSKHSIIAKTRGFARIGSNWVDVVPFSPHAFNFYLSEDNSTCYLSITTGSPESSLPSKEKVLTSLHSLKYPKEFLKNEDKIYALIIKSIQNRKSYKKVCISQDKDCEVSVDISTDKVIAYLNLHKGVGKGSPLDVKKLKTLIQSYQFKDVDFDKINRDLKNFISSKEMVLKNYVIVEGIAPTQGESRFLEFKLDFMSQKEFSKIRIENKNFPINYLTKASYVTKGKQLAQFSVPSGAKVVGTTGRDIFGKEIPGMPGNDPDIVIVDGLRMNGNHLIASTDGLLVIAEKEESIFLLVTSYKNANIEIIVSEDRLRAFLNIDRPEGSGLGIDMEMLTNTLTKAKVNNGVDKSRLEEALDIFIAGGEVRNFLIAQGTPPSNSFEGRIIYQFPDIKGLLRKDNKFNIPVKKGQHLIDVRLSDSIVEGKDVYNRPIPGISDEDFSIEIGRNITREDSDSVYSLFAENAGELIYEDQRIYIRDSEYIDGNLTRSKGKLRFPGSIIIKGDITPGSVAIAGGDIHVYQGVQSALLSADGSIIVKMGVRGLGKGVLRAKKHINLSFVENSTLMSVGNVNITKSCLRVNINCNGRIFLNKTQSSLVGGVIKSRRGLEVLNLGSESAVTTRVSFGQDYLVENKIAAEERDIEKLKQTILKIDQIMVAYEKNQKKEGLDKIRKQKVDIMKKMEKKTLAVFNLREKYEEHFESDVVIWGSIFPGVVLESHGREYVVETKLKNVKFYFEKETGHIKYESI